MVEVADKTSNHNGGHLGMKPARMSQSSCTLLSPCSKVLTLDIFPLLYSTAFPRLCYLKELFCLSTLAGNNFSATSHFIPSFVLFSLSLFRAWKMIFIFFKNPIFFHRILLISFPFVIFYSVSSLSYKFYYPFPSFSSNFIRIQPYMCRYTVLISTFSSVIYNLSNFGTQFFDFPINL